MTLNKRQLLTALRSYSDDHKKRSEMGEVLAPSKKDPSVKRWQKEGQATEAVTNIPVSSRTWGAGETDNGKRFKDFFSSITNTQGFGQHIDTSIPGFLEHRVAQAYAVSEMYPKGSILDVGASEGQWGRTIHKNAPDARVVNLDPNPDMLKNNVDTLGEKALGAWVEGFHDGEQDIPAYTTPADQKHDVVGMHMVRQFVTRDGDEWYGEVKHHLKPNGVFMYSCKVTPSAGKEQDWKDREAEKDVFKRRTYTQEEMDTKSDEVLVGMHHLMMPHEEEMASLQRHFAHVLPVWHEANFRGYFASDDHQAASRLAKRYDEAYKSMPQDKE
jgi:spermidine synthase